METENIRKCNICASTKDLEDCSGCEKVWYCSRACKRRDWPTHKDVCEQRINHRCYLCRVPITCRCKDESNIRYKDRTCFTTRGYPMVRIVSSDGLAIEAHICSETCAKIIAHNERSKLREKYSDGVKFGTME